jgi:D-3-phosphoglycerate dehydrogenase
MVRARVLISDPIDREGIRILEEEGFEVDPLFNLTHERLRQIISNYNALIVRGRTQVTRDIIEAGRNLKVVARAGTGLDNIDVESAGKKGVVVLNAPEALSNAVAELAIGLIISLLYDIPQVNRDIKQGEVASWRIFRKLRGKTIGIIGLGRIGSLVAQKAKAAFDANILVCDPLVSEEKAAKAGCKLVELSDLLRKADIVSLHVPLTKETRRMIGRKQIEMMKDGAYLINTSRGAVIDEEALTEALLTRKLSGAALDVYQVEPPTNVNLVKLPNVICTPHIGSQTVEAQREASIIIAKKVVETLRSTRGC